MRICFTAEEGHLDSIIDQRFGRCKYFLFVNSEMKGFESVPNPNVNGMGGVGIQSAQLVADKKAKIVITGKVGPNASEALKAANIEVILNADGTVKEMLEKFLKGELTILDGPNAEEKSGVN